MKESSPKYPSIDKLLQKPPKSTKLNVSGKTVYRQATFKEKFNEDDIVENLSDSLDELIASNADPKIIQKKRTELNNIKINQKQNKQLEQKNIEKINQIDHSKLVTEPRSPVQPKSYVEAVENLKDSQMSPTKPIPEDRLPTPPRGPRTSETSNTNVAQSNLNDALERPSPFNRFAQMQAKAKMNRDKAIQKAKAKAVQAAKNELKDPIPETPTLQEVQETQAISKVKKAAQTSKAVQDAESEGSSSAESSDVEILPKQKQKSKSKKPQQQKSKRTKKKKQDDDDSTNEDTSIESTDDERKIKKKSSANMKEPVQQKLSFDNVKRKHAIFWTIKLKVQASKQPVQELVKTTKSWFKTLKQADPTVVLYDARDNNPTRCILKSKNIPTDIKSFKRFCGNANPNPAGGHVWLNVWLGHDDTSDNIRANMMGWSTQNDSTMRLK